MLIGFACLAVFAGIWCEITGSDLPFSKRVKITIFTKCVCRRPRTDDCNKIDYVAFAKAQAGDLSTPSQWTHFVKDCNIFINLVGIIREYPSKNITFENTHVQGTKNAIHVAKSVGIKRFLQMSANGASNNGVSPYQQTKHEAEELVRQSGLDYTIFAPSLIFGIGDAFINNFVTMMKRFPVFPIFGKGDYRLQPIYVGDVAAAFVESIFVENCFGKRFCLGGAEVLTYSALIKPIGDALHRSIFTPSIPLGLVGFLTQFMERFPFYPITCDQLNMLVEGNVCGDCEIFDILSIHRKGFRCYLQERFQG